MSDNALCCTITQLLESAALHGKLGTHTYVTVGICTAVHTMAHIHITGTHLHISLVKYIIIIAIILTKLSRHKHILTFYASGKSGDSHQPVIQSESYLNTPIDLGPYGPY